MTDSLSVDDWARLVLLWLPTRPFMYADFTVERFIAYVIHSAKQSRLRVGRDPAGKVDAIIIWDDLAGDPETVYIECVIGRAHEFLRLRKDLPARYKFFAKHRHGIFAKYPLLSNQKKQQQ